MDVVNPFILKNKIGMVKFVDELCNVELIDPTTIDTSTLDVTNNDGTMGLSSFLDEQTSNPAHDLATIHTICEKYQTDLQQQANKSQAAKRLVTILKILTKHKQYYLNLTRTSKQSVNTTLV